jgi:alginate O-acetyltransferase complex protein AlgI
MFFVTREFLLAFLPALLGAFHVALAFGFRRMLLPILLVGSVVFYAWGNPWQTPILATSILINYFAGRILGEVVMSASQRKFVFIAALAFNLGMLAFFKYSNFALENVAELFGVALPHLDIALTIGISFYTFTQIAFLVDIYSKGQKQRDLASYGMFVTYFPHLIAGPIVHWREMMPQFRMLGRSDGIAFCSAAYAALLIEGTCLFSIGLLKKLLIADQLSVFVDLGYKDVAALSFADAWLLSLAYTFQLYFDFSSYADMAVGISLLFGIRLPFNFNSPYKADSIQDFWRRWHITLSRWLRDYLYIPLGGNRVSTIFAYRNLFVTFLLGGLWHGAAWTFIAWGALHGFGCCVQKAWASRGLRMPEPLAIIVTFLFVNFAWIYFRAPDLATAHGVLAAMIHPGPGLSTLMRQACPLLLVAALIVWLFPNSQSIAAADWRGRIPLSGALAGAAAVVAMVATNTSISSPFIYYNF